MLLLLGVIYTNQRELYRPDEAEAYDLVSMLGENNAFVNSMGINHFRVKIYRAKLFEYHV